MEWLLYIVAALFFIIGAACVVAIILQLPGAWIMIGLALVIEYCDRFYLPADDQQTFRWWVIGLCVGLALLGELLEFLSSAAGAKRGGASRRGMVGALIGGIVGAIVLTAPLAFIPVIGTIIGALIGTFVGAVVGEISAEQHAGVRGSLKPAAGATVGRILGTVGKMGTTVSIWLILSVAAFVP